MSEPVDFVVNRSDLRQCKVVVAAPRPLADGEVRLRVDRFAFTANNVTYGAVGDMIGYWNFFAAAEGWGRIPVWGFADVGESRCAALPAGERVYGYLPMSTQLIVQPAPVSPGSFFDAAPHRAALPAVYNQYTRLAADPLYERADEAHLALLRPLFTTSFLLEDFLAEHDDFAARNIVLTSASSKTGLGLAQLLSAQRCGGRRVIGLTSAGNAAFVRGTGYYDDVITYDSLTALPADTQAVLVDFAGNGALLAGVHRQLGDRLAYSCRVGITHWENQAAPHDIPGPTPIFFFAPTQVDKRIADWGAADFQRRVGAALRAFITSSAGWLRIVEHRGPAAVTETYQSMVDGNVDPALGHMLSLTE